MNRFALSGWCSNRVFVDQKTERTVSFQADGRKTRWLKAIQLCLLFSGVISFQALAQQGDQEPRRGLSSFGVIYSDNCAVCHGQNMEGAAQGKPLVGVDLTHGDTIADLSSSIAEGFPDKGMPAWSASFSADEIKSLAMLVSERRGGFEYGDFKISTRVEIPTETFHSEKHAFRLEVVIDDLDPLPYSISPLPDGSILLTEKTRGLSVISPDGEQSALLEGTPKAYNDTREGPAELQYGLGWLMDVEPHPDYEENGWIYLHYTDRCSGCNAMSRQMGRPVSMNALVRGRIEDHRWVDEEVIWKADVETYTAMTDLASGGRLTFDPDGYVFISVGMKGMGNAAGIQDLSTPYGKIHRLHDDGRIPSDNPFIDDPLAMNTIWTYGHRSPQGLEFNTVTRDLWGTEHGPRGGDEVNRLLPGRNYGWPLYSKGINYNGTEVAYGKELGIEYELKDIQQPVVDLTPSPAVSSFTFYEGDAFPGWRHDLIVGTLKATDLYRLTVEENRFVHKEILIENLARIRDVEVGADGEIYLLLEHATGGQIVRLVPEKSEVASTR